MLDKEQLKNKIFTVLEALLKGNSFNRFEAEIELHDHCLPSTISSIQTKYKITVNRVFETVTNYQGDEVSCCRYWMEVDQIQKYKEESDIIKKPSSAMNTKEAL